jgi:hypothetical protein
VRRAPDQRESCATGRRLRRSYAQERATKGQSNTAGRLAAGGAPRAPSARNGIGRIGSADRGRGFPSPQRVPHGREEHPHGTANDQ